MAAEAAKKGGGDDLQLLSHWHVYNRAYHIMNPITKEKESKNRFDKKKNPVFFVSHDGPTVVRALIEGDDVLFMYSQIIGGQKYECAVSLIRGEVEQPPLYETLKRKYDYIRHKFTGNENIYEKISEINENRETILNEYSEKFREVCDSEIPATLKKATEYITKLLTTSTELCILRNLLGEINEFKYNVEAVGYKFYHDNVDSLHDIILGLTEESKEEDLIKLSAIIKTLEDKNGLVIEEASKYDAEKRISAMTKKRISASPDILALNSWNVINRQQRVVVDNKVLYEQYFENYAKQFTGEESMAFINSLNKVVPKFLGDRLIENVQTLLSYAITRLDTSDEETPITVDDIEDERINTMTEIANDQLEIIKAKANSLGDISNFEETKREPGMEILTGGARQRKTTTLYSTNDRGIPYSPILSILTNNLFVALKNEEQYIQRGAYNEREEDERAPPDESELLGVRNIANIPTTENERTRRYTVVETKGGKSSVKGGEVPNDFEDILIMGKIIRLLPKDKAVEYVKEFERAGKQSLQKWVNFQFPNPISSFHLIFYTFELFFEDIERKIKTSSYLPEFIAYFFTIKRYADELISLCETTNRDNLVERFKAIRRIGSVFNLLFYSFPYMDKGEESIGELLKTEKSYEFSRITMNLIYQYAGTVEYDKKQSEKIKNNKNILMKTDVWNSFVENIGRNTMDEMFNIFRQYDNSTLLIFLGIIKLQETNKTKDMAEMLKRISENRIFGSSNLTASALWDSEKKAEDKRKVYNKQQDLMFGTFLKNLKKYNHHLFEWKLKDVLNNPIYINSIYSPSSKQSPSRITKKNTPSPRKGTPSQSSANRSVAHSLKRLAPGISAYGGRKTRRNRK
jgi:hypothetical protein